MAGYSKAFVVGGEGGYMGSDGVNPIDMFILVGDADRQWLEPIYVRRKGKPLGRIKSIIPAMPDDPMMVLDACLAFMPDYFSDCPSLPAISERLIGEKRIDLHLGTPNITMDWIRLREEAKNLFAKLPVWACDFTRINQE